jgi:hypothetical protein
MSSGIPHFKEYSIPWNIVFYGILYSTGKRIGILRAVLYSMKYPKETKYLNIYCIPIVFRPLQVGIMPNELLKPRDFLVCHICHTARSRLY